MKDPLGDRMKLNYESRSQGQLTRRTPVIVRIDGRSFSKFCKRFKKPYDANLHRMLNNVTKTLCNKIQGVKFAERHSDEISLLLTDYDSVNTDAFFDYSIQKMCSVISGITTAAFIKELLKGTYSTFTDDCGDIVTDRDFLSDKFLSLDEEWPHFDARCFNIPESDITNYFLWRTQDSSRNSVGMHTRSMFSAKQMHGVSTSGMKDMMLEKDFDWEALPQEQKTGFIFVKREVEREIPAGRNKGEKYTRNELMAIPSVSSYLFLKEEISIALTPKELAEA
jgi:tRNA(His) 5'-end guanylyltransferase